MYELGVGTEKDPRKAVEWLKRAAQAGDPTAQIQLGRKLALGDGVEKDDQKAFAMFNMVRCLSHTLVLARIHTTHTSLTALASSALVVVVCR
jgi:TPR repeat protein